MRSWNSNSIPWAETAPSISTHSINELAVIISSTRNQKTLETKDRNNGNTVPRSARALLRWLKAEVPGITPTQLHDATNIYLGALTKILKNEYIYVDQDVHKDASYLQKSHPEHFQAITKWCKPFRPASVSNRTRKGQQPAVKPQATARPQSPVTPSATITKKRKRDRSDWDNDNDQTAQAPATSNVDERPKKKKQKKNNNSHSNPPSHSKQSVSFVADSERRKSSEQHHAGHANDMADRCHKLAAFFKAIHYTPAEPEELVGENLGPAELMAISRWEMNDMKGFLGMYPPLKDLNKAEAFARILVNAPKSSWDHLRH